MAASPLIKALEAFRANTRGTVAVLFALTMIPLIFLVGAALDYAGAANLQTHLQRATDATNLQLCQTQGAPTQAQLQSAGAGELQSYMGTTAASLDSLVYVASPRTIAIKTSSIFKTAIVGAFYSSLANVTVTASASCSSQLQSFEIALVLDNTGSMANSSGGQSKIQALQTAATNFVNAVYASPTMGPYSKLSLVPFAAGVAVTPSTYRTASWIDQTGISPYSWNFVQGGAVGGAILRAGGMNNRLDVLAKLQASQSSWAWNGCFESVAYPLNVQDGKPSISTPNSLYVPMLAADESGNGGQYAHSSGWTTIYSENSYMNDDNAICGPTSNEATLTGQACKYLQIINPRTSNGYIATGPNFSCTSRPLTRLTNSQATLLSEISQMSPNGNTDIHEGLMWGWRTLSPNSVFADGVAYNTTANNKVIILMTDGTNTWSANPYNPTLKSYYSAYGFYTNPDGTTPNSRMPSGNANVSNDTQARAAIDALTLEACANARAAGVLIYTIAFSVQGDPIDQQGINLLTQCAGNANQAYVATDASSINTVFQQIAASIGNLRLTR